MDLRLEILKEHSKAHTVKLAKWVRQDRQRFRDLMQLFFKDEYRVVQRSAWIVKNVADDHPDWIIPYIKLMLEYCKKPVHDAVKRNVMRIMQEIHIPKSLQGLAATTCFDFIISSDEPVAVKVFAMTVLYNISKEEPKLKNELITVIEEQMEYGKAAFRSRGSKILQRLKE